MQSSIGINDALRQFEGEQGWLLPVMAKLLALTPVVPQRFSKTAATPAQPRRLLTATGSRIDPEGKAQHQHLQQMPGHVEATLAVMAQANRQGLMRRNCSARPPQPRPRPAAC